MGSVYVEKGSSAVDWKTDGCSRGDDAVLKGWTTALATVTCMWHGGNEQMAPRQRTSSTVVLDAAGA